MSYGSIPGPSGQAVHKELHTLLQTLSWSYVALWSFNPQLRSLEFTGGHFRGNSSAETRHSDREIWNEQFFNFTHKDCMFTPGQGSVGMAYAEQKNIWMNGESVHRSAGSEQQAQFLQHARIETAVYISSAESVLELGTCERVAEDVDLINLICGFMRNDILPTLGHVGVSQDAQSLLATTHCSPVLLLRGSSPAPMVLCPVGIEPRVGQTDTLFTPTSKEDRSSYYYLRDSMKHQADKFLSEDFEHPTSLNTDMFLQQVEEEEGREEVGKLRATKGPAALMRLQYRSHSGGTTSSSLSSFEDSSVKLSVDSPEPSVSLMASSSQCHNYATSSAQRETPSNSPEFHTSTRAGMGAPHHVHDIQQAMIRHVLDEGEQEPWLHMDMDASLETENAIMRNSSGAMLQNISPAFDGEPEPPLLLQATSSTSSWPSDEPSAFKEWRPTHVVSRRMEGSTHQCLLRCCFEFLRHIPRAEAHAGSSVQPNFGMPAPHLTSSSSPKPLPERDPFDQVGPSRGQRRSRGGARIGTPGRPDHDEAAEHHMMKERHRRMRQKENFTALRKLVPIISKNDKASILGDAIIYLKNLQARIQELEANMAEMASQYEKLKLSHQEMQEQYKQLEAMVSATGPVLNP